MKKLGKWMLGAAVAAGTLGLGATTAQAAQFGVYVGGGPAAYVPPSPGPGYTWVAGYYANGYWVPGTWSYVGVRGWDRDDFRGRDFDRDRDGRRDDHYRDGDRNRGGDHYRGDDHPRDRR